MEDLDLDALAEEASRILDLSPGRASEVVLTLAEHHDRRVIAPLIDLLASRRADELVVRAAGWLADPALHPALATLSEARLADLGDDRYWDQVARATARCRPGAAAEAEEVEITLLAATQAALIEVASFDVDVSLAGAYPVTEVVVRIGDHERRHSVWNFDELEPDDPGSLDRAFALYRISRLASWG
ncbi:MAG: hypothetical protein KDB04_11695 [Acidimicrobiales bacterium]|nr:hypothetical protein [Acidimicrobiales bacterium]MCB1039190.1 hypothetical protein [Acidimicrobiales bacterium]